MDFSARCCVRGVTRRCNQCLAFRFVRNYSIIIVTYGKLLSQRPSEISDLLNMSLQSTDMLMTQTNLAGRMTVVSTDVF